MEDLANSLKSVGLKVKIKNGKIAVRLDGLSNPVSIVKDISADEYKVKTNDSILSIVACFLLFVGLSGVYGYSGSNLINFALISVSILSFVTVLLTELKLTRLRATVAAFNRGERA
ncbi:hypothetical protein ACXITX_23470 [Vibrio parahaemolyticus]|uniref:hypothetical protein n=1 Tax=Vibrio parahaemolyticus TaxID=670 RepID=UPI0009B67587|nr:hypothetical protein [Vibrio parahaemolyticus]MBE3775411.1 hypothetical protein [Vibrio parahaemolyticus]MBE4300552.1 hypothetical protein [Vibrio parahaemolyticus]MBE4304991.1 hypothetical protein [Vibrio parahaemolyticus]MDF4730096.1 hypothetical protein [Vibrio parahaemolyticus]MDF4956804.1 hypothetical protein [Vibrio parahaemolyticus]